MSAKQKQEWMQELYMQTLLKEFMNEIEEEY